MVCKSGTQAAVKREGNVRVTVNGGIIEVQLLRGNSIE